MYLFQVNNDRSRDYTIPNVPMLNSQPSILGQQPHAMAGPGVHQYNGAHFAPAHEGHAVPPPSVGWSSGVPAVPQTMLGQMHNHHYMPPASMGSELGHSMIHLHNQNGFPHAGSMPRYPPQ